MAEVTLRNVKKDFGAVSIIKGIDLEIGNGEFCVFVGPSGCGKSTLLRMVAGLEEITSGELKIGGRDMTQVGPSDRGVAMVFQSYALYPHMTVAENIGFGLKMTGHDRAEIAKRTAAAAKMLQLDKLLDRKPGQLSGGQRQRVAIGRAIVRKPDVFLFDEPLSNLDAALRVQMRLEIARLHQRLQATMVYVTHDQVEALTLADRIVVLNGGVVQQVGTPLELYQTPANRFVAQFIGSPTMNILAINQTDRGVRLANGTEMALPGIAGPVAELGIRPEHLDIADPAHAPLTGTADVVEHLGSDTNAYILVDGVGPLMVRQHGHVPLRAGDHVGLTVQPGQIHAFAPDGRALRA